MRIVVCALTAVLATGAVVAAQRGNVPPAPSDLTAPPADAVKSGTGLISRTVTPGNGTEKAEATDMVTVHYTGWSADGRVVDSSFARGNPSTFPVDRVLPGWRECLLLMTVGVYGLVAFTTAQRLPEMGVRIALGAGRGRIRSLIFRDAFAMTILGVVGGVAAGLSGIATPKFLMLNFLSAAIWASLFVTVGYVFGLAAESIVGATLARHQRLLVGLGAGLAFAALGWLVSRYLARRVALR